MKHYFDFIFFSAELTLKITFLENCLTLQNVYLLIIVYKDRNKGRQKCDKAELKVKLFKRLSRFSLRSGHFCATGLCNIYSV